MAIHELRDFQMVRCVESRRSVIDIQRFMDLIFSSIKETPGKPVAFNASSEGSSLQVDKQSVLLYFYPPVILHPTYITLGIMKDVHTA